METGNSSAIVIRHLKKSFGNNEILRDINLTVCKGENVSILGKSGTGKSVLAKCIIGLYPADSGKIEVLGKNIPDLDYNELEQLRKKIGYLFQGGALYDSMTVSENLEFPVRRTQISKNKKEVHHMVKEALENVGLLDTINKYPSELSGGMKKRIGLARTLILKPEIILYDEPTTGLDPVTAREISELIRDVQKKYNTASIIITHDIQCAKITSNRLMLLKDGVITLKGTYNQLKNSSEKDLMAYFNSYHDEPVKAF